MHHVSNVLLEWDLQNSQSLLMEGINVCLFDATVCYLRQISKCLLGKATVFNKIPVISQILQMLCIHNVQFKIYMYGATEGML